MPSEKFLLALAGGAFLVIYAMLQAMYWYNQRDGVVPKRGGSEPDMSNDAQPARISCVAR